MVLINKLSKYFKIKKETQFNHENEIVIHKDNNILKLRIEIINPRWWHENLSKPVFSTGFFMIPLSQALEMVNGLDELKNYLKEDERQEMSIDAIREIIYKNKDSITTNTQSKTILIKSNFNEKYMCIITSDTVLKSINKKLTDQKSINENIELQKKYSYIKQAGFDFHDNIWYYSGRKNIKTELYNTDIFLILGLLKDNSDIIWTNIDEVTDIIKSLI